MKTKRILCALVALLGLAVLQGYAQQLTINIRYTGENGSARKYVEEMESSGIAARIRAIEGCIRYDYFYPADDPERHDRRPDRKGHAEVRPPADGEGRAS